MEQNIKEVKEKVFSVKNMHCASCEVLIERKLLDLKNIKSAEASMSKESVVVEYEGNPPAINQLNQMFGEEKYVFSEYSEQDHKFQSCLGMIIGGFLVLLFILIFSFLPVDKININPASSWWMFLAFGLTAGVSSCAALVGGMVLSMSKQWSSQYDVKDNFVKKLEPHIFFNSGRLISYLLAGIILGALGGKISGGLKFGPVVVILISLLMVVLAMQMLGVKAFNKIRLSAPKSFSRVIAEGKGFKSKSAPWLLGAATIFLPCGFTLTAEGIALLSGSMWRGAMVMFLFALGTLPTLFFIGLSSVKFSEKTHRYQIFIKAAGILVLFFALFNIKSQFNVLGWNFWQKTSVGVSEVATNKTPESDLPPIVDGVQVLKMNASSRGYVPDHLKVRANIPVRWEVTDTGTSGCTNAIISKSLFVGEINLTPGQTSIKEFTPTRAGKYSFSCWMGMVSGVIEVVN